MEINHDLIYRLTIVLTPKEAKQILNDFDKTITISPTTHTLVDSLVSIVNQDDECE